MADENVVPDVTPGVEVTPPATPTPEAQDAEAKPALVVEDKKSSLPPLDAAVLADAAKEDVLRETARDARDKAESEALKKEAPPKRANLNVGAMLGGQLDDKSDEQAQKEAAAYRKTLEAGYTSPFAGVSF